MTKHNSYSRRLRPAVYDCARETHYFILRALKGVRDRNSILARRGAERAALAVELATAGDSPGRNVECALTAIRTSMFHCDTLCELKIIDRKLHDYLRRSVDRIIAGLEQLITTPVDQWLSLQLPPLEAEPTEPSEAAPPTRFQAILDRVAQAARSLLPAPAPPPGNGASSEQEPQSGERIEPATPV